MNNTIQNLKATRKFFLNSISSLTTEQLNAIPAGFSNNIAWNLAHLVAAQQGLCYVRAGLPLAVPEDFFESYKPGSRPARFIPAEEITAVKELLMTSLDRLEADVAAGLFRDYPVVKIRYEIEFKNIEDVLAFLPFHDGFHTGVINALAKIV